MCVFSLFSSFAFRVSRSLFFGSRVNLRLGGGRSARFEVVCGRVGVCVCVGGEEKKGPIEKSGGGAHTSRSKQGEEILISHFSVDGPLAKPESGPLRSTQKSEQQKRANKTRVQHCPHCHSSCSGHRTGRQAPNGSGGWGSRSRPITRARPRQALGKHPPKAAPPSGHLVSHPLGKPPAVHCQNSKGREHVVVATPE